VADDGSTFMSTLTTSLGIALLYLGGRVLASLVGAEAKGYATQVSRRLIERAIATLPAEGRAALADEWGRRFEGRTEQPLSALILALRLRFITTRRLLRSGKERDQPLPASLPAAAGPALESGSSMLSERARRQCDPLGIKEGEIERARGSAGSVVERPDWIISYGTLPDGRKIRMVSPHHLPHHVITWRPLPDEDPPSGWSAASAPLVPAT
jgi:hypothetical protein